MARLFLILWLISGVAAARPLVIAHRGGANIGPENRLETFAKSIALGVDGVEVDIHQSADGHLMALHDLTLNRCFGMEGKVNAMTLDELREVGVPTLGDVVDLVDGRCLLFIEVKQPKDGTRHQGIEKRLVDFIRRRSLQKQVVIISFYPDTIAKFEKLAPELPTGFLLSRELGDFKRWKEELGVDYIGPRYTLLDRTVVEEAHRLGLGVVPWTVNGLEDLKRYVKMGCDGITTNDPHLLEALANPWMMSW